MLQSYNQKMQKKKKKEHILSLKRSRAIKTHWEQDALAFFRSHHDSGYTAKQMSCPCQFCQFIASSLIETCH